MSAWLDAALEGGAALEDAEGTRVSAEALRARVEARAEALREAGLAPGERVLVAREKSVALVVDLLAIARAGGVMVPVDPRTPRARLERIARDAQVAMWIDDAGMRVLEGERASEVLAYVIYTSGSSGVPAPPVDARSTPAARRTVEWRRTVSGWSRAGTRAKKRSAGRRRPPPAPRGS